MRVEIWSDFVCPFCYIGKRRFEAGLAKFPHRDKIEIVYRSFELDPNAPRNSELNVYESLAKKYGMSLELSKKTHDDVTKQAAAVGLTYRFDTAIRTNTFDAHRLVHFAARFGKMEEMKERLLQAYFTESKHIGDPDTLAALAAEVGLDQAETAAMLAGDQYAQEVRADEQEASSLGIRGVPFFVINRKYAVSGAQPSDVFLNALQTAWDENSPLTIVGDPTHDTVDEACTDGVCTPPVEKE